jgi:hypothetical protein
MNGTEEERKGTGVALATSAPRRRGPPRGYPVRSPLTCGRIVGFVLLSAFIAWVVVNYYSIRGHAQIPVIFCASPLAAWILIMSVRASSRR